MPIGEYVYLGDNMVYNAVSSRLNMQFFGVSSSILLNNSDLNLLAPSKSADPFSPFSFFLGYVVHQEKLWYKAVTQHKYFIYFTIRILQHCPYTIGLFFYIGPRNRNAPLIPVAYPQEQYPL